MNKEEMKNIFSVPSTEPDNVTETEPDNVTETEPNNTIDLKPKKEPLKRLMIRVTPTMYDAITAISEQKSVSKSAICRLMFADRLADYLGTQNYVDIEDGKKLIILISNLLTLVGKIRSDLNRIGVNYNQEVRLMHNKEKNKSNVIKMMQEEKEIQKGINVVNIEDIRMLIDRQDKVITKAGQIACTLVSHPQKMVKRQ